MPISKKFNHPQGRHSREGGNPYVACAAMAAVLARELSMGPRLRGDDVA
jgi:hypothetical protein